MILKAPDIFTERERALAQKKFACSDDSIFNPKRRNNQTRSECMLHETKTESTDTYTLYVYRANYPHLHYKKKVVA